MGSNQEERDLQGAWACQRCRRVPIDVATTLCEARDLRASVDSITEIKAALSNHQKNNTDLVKQLAAKTACVTI